MSLARRCARVTSSGHDESFKFITACRNSLGHFHNFPQPHRSTSYRALLTLSPLYKDEGRKMFRVPFPCQAFSQPKGGRYKLSMISDVGGLWQSFSLLLLLRNIIPPSTHLTTYHTVKTFAPTFLFIYPTSRAYKKQNVEVQGTRTLNLGLCGKWTRRATRYHCANTPGRL